MTTETQATPTITPDEAAEMFKLATTSASKWAFLDGVSSMVDAQPSLSQREVVDQIGDTSTFIGMHGHYRDEGVAGAKAKSKLKSIRDELSVVKVWAPKDRVEGVSFEAHKVLNRLGASSGRKILTTLVKEMGGPGNVTKSAVVNRLKVADPDHVPQNNGKVATNVTTTTGAAGNPVVTRDMTVLEMATALGEKLNVGELAKDTALASAVEKIADIYEAFSLRKAAKDAKVSAAPKADPAPKAPKSAAPKRGRVAPPSKRVATPSARPQQSRPAVKTPTVKAPV